jgi:hypothetical protein
VPRAGIEPTPRTDIGYRPVTQTHQTRREPLGHHVPHVLGLYFYSLILNSTRIWRVGEWLSAPLPGGGKSIHCGEVTAMFRVKSLLILGLLSWITGYV